MAAECCSSYEYQRTVGYPSTSWASCFLHGRGYVYLGAFIDLRAKCDIAALCTNSFAAVLRNDGSET